MLDSGWFERLRDEARMARSCGARVAAVRALVEASGSAPLPEQVSLTAVIGEVLRDPAASATERATLQALTGQAAALVERANPAIARQVIMAANSLQVVQHDAGAGCANALLAGNWTLAGQPYGAVHVLQVRTSQGGADTHWTDPDHGKGAHVSAFMAGVAEARSWVSSQGRLSGAMGGRFIRHFLIRGSLPKCRVNFDGASIGLASVVAAGSALLNAPVSPEAAFSAVVESNGRLGAVEAIAPKLKAASDVGLTTVYVSNRQKVTAAPSDVEIVSCATVNDVLRRVMAPGQVAAGVEALASHVLALPDEVQSGDGPVVLLSFVAKSDPLGVLKDQRGRSIPGTVGEGALLGASRYAIPEFAHIFYTDATAGHDNNYEVAADDSASALEREFPGIVVTLNPVSVGDPTLLTSIYSALEPVVRDVRAQHTGARFFVNVSSGTDDMRVAWHLLIERGVLAADLLQVREPRFAQDGSRVRAVRLPESHL